MSHSGLTYGKIDSLPRSVAYSTALTVPHCLPIGLPPIYHFGSQEMQDRVLPEVLSGQKRICLAITEPEAGSDVKNLSTSAVLSDDGKHFIVK